MTMNNGTKPTYRAIPLDASNGDWAVEETSSGNCWSHDGWQGPKSGLATILTKEEAETKVLNLSAQTVEHKKSVLSVLVVVTGEASDPDDENLPGVYGHEVTLSRPVTSDGLTPAEEGAIAEAVIDEFHDHQGIGCLDDFEIDVRIENGQSISELEDTSEHDSDFVKNVEHLSKVADIDDESHEQPRA